VDVDAFAQALTVDTACRGRERGKPRVADVAAAVATFSVAMAGDPGERIVDLAQVRTVATGDFVVEVGGRRGGRPIGFVRDFVQDRGIRRILPYASSACAASSSIAFLCASARCRPSI